MNQPERSQGRRILIRLCFYIPIIVLLGVWNFAPFGKKPLKRPSPPEEVAASLPRRQATDEEWALGIAELGTRRLAKVLEFRQVRDDQPPIALGTLAWWHNGQEERIAYLPVAGEEGSRVGPRLARALQGGEVHLLQVHGDDSLRNRLMDLSPSYDLPAGWMLLDLPPGISTKH